MKRNTLKHLKALGILFMTGITLASVTPTNSIANQVTGNTSVQASRRYHHKKRGRKAHRSRGYRRSRKRRRHYNVKKMRGYRYASRKTKTYLRHWQHERELYNAMSKKNPTKSDRKREYAYAQQVEGNQSKAADAIQKQINQLSAQEDKARDHMEHQGGNQDAYKEQDAITGKIVVHKGERRWAKKIKQINSKIGKLEQLEESLGGSLATDKANEKVRQYDYSIQGDVKSVKTMSYHRAHEIMPNFPRHVVITSPTYYFDDYDITNKNQRDMRVKPYSPKKNPYHEVLSISSVELKTGQTFQMLRIKANNPYAAYSYLILADDTTPAKLPHKTYHVHSFSFRRKGYITQGTAIKYNKLPSSHITKHAKAVGTLHMGRHPHIVRAYYFNKRKNSPFAFKLSDGSYVRADEVYASVGGRLHSAHFKKGAIHHWTHGSHMAHFSL